MDYKFSEWRWAWAHHRIMTVKSSPNNMWMSGELQNAVRLDNNGLEMYGVFCVVQCSEWPLSWRVKWTHSRYQHLDKCWKRNSNVTILKLWTLLTEIIKMFYNATFSEYIFVLLSTMNTFHSSLFCRLCTRNKTKSIIKLPLFKQFTNCEKYETESVRV